MALLSVKDSVLPIITAVKEKKKTFITKHLYIFAQTGLLMLYMKWGFHIDCFFKGTLSLPYAAV